ncbi:MAG: sodium-dependent transporter, partial [Pseudomonadota bacterium]|nr:sodium-dependent transporter [Pseudomonadota bacterium]
MLRKYQTSIGSFTRKSTFFWASVGATVGLANLWQFPYLASIHGGGLFILLYLACLLIVALPLMVTEAVIGRHARHGIVLALDGMVKNAGCSPFWRLAGPLSILAAFVVLSFTAVFGGIVLAYIFFGAADRFEGASAASATAVLSELVSDPGHYRQFMAWHVFFVILVVAVSARGVVKGLERSMRMIVPCTLLLMLVLFGLAAMGGSLQSGIDHVLVMRPEQVTAASIKAAF